MRTLVVLTSLLLFAQESWAAPCTAQSYSLDTEPNYSCPGPGEGSIVPELKLQASTALAPGDRAPWSGILVDKQRLVLLGLRIKGLRRLRWLDMHLSSQRQKAELKFQKSKSKADIDFWKLKSEALRKNAEAWRAKAESSNKWYKSAPLWFAVGVLTASAAAVAVASVR